VPEPRKAAVLREAGGDRLGGPLDSRLLAESAQGGGRAAMSRARKGGEPRQSCGGKGGARGGGDPGREGRRVEFVVSQQNQGATDEVGAFATPTQPPGAGESLVNRAGVGLRHEGVREDVEQQGGFRRSGDRRLSEQGGSLCSAGRQGEEGAGQRRSAAGRDRPV